VSFNRKCAWLVVAVVVTLVLSAGVASAQIREGTKEGYFLFEYLGSTTEPWSKHPDVSLKVDPTWYWGFGGGFNPSEKFGWDFDLLFANSYIEATGAGATPGSTVTLTQGATWFNGRLNGFYYPVEGRFTPLLTAGIGWANTVTKVPGAPPIYSCLPSYYYWWCGYSYPSMSETGFSYNGGVGFRYDPPNSQFFLKLVYSFEWVQTSVTKGTPMRSGAYVTLGSKF